VVLGFSIFLSPSAPHAVDAPSATPVAAWSPLPPAEEDEALPVLVAATDEDLSAAACKDVESCLVDLSEDEAQGLATALRQELEGRRL
jgi:hypothetical protein